MTRFVTWLARTSGPYPADAARADLAALRNERLFRLMRDYAAAAVAGGTTDFRVRRQYGQALIELKDKGAVPALVSLLDKPDQASAES